MKQRFSSLDVKVIAYELSTSLCSLRLANAYDLSSRIFLLKFAKPNHRQQLVIDSGFRCHLTSFNRVTATAPSAFVTRLRKFLRTRRVTSVSQVGTDRIIEIQFSDGQYRLFLEFYAGGNIVLTDKELNILALLRIVSEGHDQEELRVGLKYSLDNRQNYKGIPPLSVERVKEALQRAIDKDQGEPVAPSKKAKQKAGNDLRKALAVSINEYPPTLVEHALRVSEFDSSLRPEEVLRDEALLEGLINALKAAEQIMQDITSSGQSKGYIIAKPLKGNTVVKPPSEGVTDDNKQNYGNLMYDDFHPFRPRQFQDNADLITLIFEGFNKAVDEFFSSIEAQKLESRVTEREDHAKKKLEAARQDHVKRLGGLQQIQELNVRKAQAIEANLQRVEEAVGAINGLVAQGMDWVEIARLIEMEQSRQNPVAEMIGLPLKLYENTATLLLAETTFEDEIDYEGDETDSDVSDSDAENGKDSTKVPKDAKPTEKRLAVDVDLALSPWSNARQYYEQKKTAAVKEQKTLQSSSKALRNTEKKITADLKKGLKQEKQILRPVRKQLWFEKFVFFISSDGYLVLGGKDAQQNEILYKRYLKKGDVYVHADLHGAASVIIKNNSLTPGAPVPPSTLSQAGNLSVVTSSAWDSKAIMSAWWVNSEQVSKTAPTGEYLTTGGFMVRGKKNFLPPAQLLMGFGVMFQISEESKPKHVKHRLLDKEKSVGDLLDSTLPRSDATEPAPVPKIHQEALRNDDDLDDQEQPTDEEDDSATESEAGENSLSVAGHVNPLQSDGALPMYGRITDDDDDSSQQDEEAEEVGDYEQSDKANSEQDPEDEDSEEIGYTDKDDHNEEAVAKNKSLNTPTTNGSSEPGVRHLSAKERRLLRKGLNPTEGSQPSPATTDNDSQDPTSNTVPQQRQQQQHQQHQQHQQPPSKTTSTPQTPHVRGKHGKLAKQKTKYAAQDDNDRALAMRLLGSQAAVQKASDDALARKAREDEAEFQKQRRREQHARATKEGKEHEEIRRMTLEEGVEVLDDDEKEELTTPLDEFVGTPLPGDELLAAIPVCAPWVALGNYKYRVKLQPGSTKKGKAVKEILHKWCVVDGGDKKKVDEKAEDGEKMWPREVELIRGWRETEVINTVPVGKVRVMMSGGGSSAGGKGGGQTKGKARGGKGSKKQR
ncbi:MAG: hypothetical protein M1830_005945 [Pleopsidium flavum]|nr:MAG: hypothetical protein M1830_005945 [Pleopsidium flavum]